MNLPFITVDSKRRQKNIPGATVKIEAQSKIVPHLHSILGIGNQPAFDGFSTKW
jgi:hypothetical protein